MDLAKMSNLGLDNPLTSIVTTRFELECSMLPAEPSPLGDIRASVVTAFGTRSLGAVFTANAPLLNLFGATGDGT